MIATPDGLPTLSRGSHAQGSGFACIMEYVSVLAGETFSDHPKCTNPYVAACAREINDHMQDEDRHLLVPLIGRLLEAHVRRGDKYTEAEVSEYLIGWSISMFRTDLRATNLLHSQRPAQRVEYLSMLLDEFDRMLGRDGADQVSMRALQHATALVRA